MPSSAPSIGSKVERLLRKVGGRIRARRKKLGISAAATAESVHMSRVTLFRIESGEASVTMGAYLSVISSLGLDLELREFDSRKREPNRGKPPQRILLAQYPQLKRLAWQLREAKEISPEEALELYERNWRHIDLASMEDNESELLSQLLAAFDRERLLV